jgi:hypothetical protein
MISFVLGQVYQAQRPPILLTESLVIPDVPVSATGQKSPSRRLQFPPLCDLRCLCGLGKVLGYFE